MNKRLLNYFILFLFTIVFMSCGQISGHYPNGTTGGGGGYGSGQPAECVVAGSSWQQVINSSEIQVLRFASDDQYTDTHFINGIQTSSISGIYSISESKLTLVNADKSITAKASVEENKLTLVYDSGEMQIYQQLTD